jgi:hypothetical protein
VGSNTVASIFYRSWPSDTNTNGDYLTFLLPSGWSCSRLQVSIRRCHLVVKVAVAAVVAVGVTPVSAAATVHDHGRGAPAIIGRGHPVPTIRIS